MITIYGSDGTVKAQAPCDDNSTQVEELQGDNVLALSFTLYRHVPLEVNDYADFLGKRYWLMEQYRPEQVSTVEWKYELKLYGIESLVRRFLVLNDTDGADEAVFTLTAPPREHVALIVRSINEGMGTTDWKVGEVAGTDNIVIDYDGKYCDEALKEVAEKAGNRAEWWMDGLTVNVCYCSRGEEITLGYGKGLTSLSCDTADNVEFYTRLYPLGSSRNIDPEHYGHTRLQLPGGVKHVDVNVDKYGVWHRFEEDAFAGIYPRYTGTVGSVRSEEVTGEDGNPYKIYYFKDDGLPFDPNDYEIGGKVKRISFQEGSALAGLGSEEDGTYYFEANFDSTTREWELITIWPYDDDTQLPNDTLAPKPGDKYIPWNFRMPDEYYPLAEQEFLEAVQDYNGQNALDVARYKAPTDHVYIEENSIDLYLGRRVRLESAKYFPETDFRSSRITKITRKVNLPSQMDVEISDAVSVGARESINDSIEGVKNYVREASGSFPDIVRSWENTPASDYNVASYKMVMKQLVERALSRMNPDQAHGLITFLQGAIFGKDGFAPGLTGFGAKIDENGNGEMDNLFLRRSLTVPLLNYNRVDIRMGDKWRAPGCGIIESVDVENKTCTLKLEDGEIGAVAVGDICMGIYHSMDSADNATEDYDDSLGNRKFAGFCTVYFTITEVTGDRNQTFKYQVRPVSERWPHAYDPFGQMTFVCYGSFQDEGRQTSVYETRTYTRMLWKQNTWEIAAANIALQYGDLSNLNAHGMQMEGYSMYLNNVYFTGIIRQTKPDGTPIRTANDRGAWEQGHYDFYDRVSHGGSIWLCVNEDGTDAEPAGGNPDWLLQVSKGQDGAVGGGIANLGQWQTGLFVPYLGIVRMGSASWQCVNPDGTTNPPMWCVTDKDGNRLKFTEDGGKNYYYVLTGEVNTGDYVLLAADGTKGEAGADGVSGKDGTSIVWKGEAAQHPEDPQDGWAYRNTTDRKSYVYQDGAWYQMTIDGVDGQPGKDGERGPQGVPGEKGEPGQDGKTLYTWIRYADDAQGTGISNDPTGKAYIGFAYNKESFAESDDPDDYQWSDIRGEDGVPGAKGEDGKTYYTWIAYSDNPDGSGMYQQPRDGTKYIGIAVNKDTATEGTDPAEYTWSLFKGADGLSIDWKGDLATPPDNPQKNWVYRDTDNGRVYIHNGSAWELMVVDGSDGADGANGADGLSVYITYHDGTAQPSAPTGNGTTGGWHTESTESSVWMSQKVAASATAGAWGEPIKIKGEQGPQGKQGLQGEKGEPGQDGQDGTGIASVDVEYASSASNTVAPTSGWQTAAPAWRQGYYIWSRTKVVNTLGETAYTQPACITGGKGSDGKGVSSVTEYYYRSTSTAVLTGGSWSTSYPGWQNGYYLWTKSRTTYTDGTYEETTPVCVTGAKGDSIEIVGDWHTGMYVNKNEVVTMGGRSFIALRGTTDPPMWCVTDKDGNRLKFTEDGGKNYYYVLTGEVNTGDYADFGGLISKGEKGDTGDPGPQGPKGDKGDTGEKGEQGVQGCILRKSEWKSGTQYRNDEALVSGTRYVDVALVKDSGAATGWRAYKCKETHDSSPSNAPGNSAYWEEFGINTTAIFTSLIIAKDALIDFMSGNQLLIRRDDGTVTAGLSGSQEGGKIRIWAGAPTPDSAPFRVSEYGKMVATDVEVTGTVNATQGRIAGFNISGNSLTNAGFDNDAAVIFRNDTTKCFAGIGGNVFPSTAGVTCVGRFENCDESDAWMWSKNVAVYLRAEGAAFNYAFMGTGNGVLDGMVEGFALQYITLNSSTVESTDISKGKYIVFYAASGTRNHLLPTRQNIQDALGIGSSQKFAVLLQYGVKYTSPGKAALYGRTTAIGGADTAQFPYLYDQNGENASVAMAKGDVVQVLVAYDGYNFFAQLVNVSK